MRPKDALGYAENYGGWAIAAVNRGSEDRAGTMARSAAHFAKIFLGEKNPGKKNSGGVFLAEEFFVGKRRGFMRG